MHSRRLRIAALAGLPALVSLSLLPSGCAQDPLTHSSFTAVATTPTPDAMTPPPSDGGPPPGDALSHGDGSTSGCGMDPGQASGTYTQYHISIAGPDLDANKQPKVRDRIYFVRLPANYDQTVPNRVVYLGPGCGGNTYTEVIKLYSASMNDAILVAVMPLPEFGGCFDETVNSVEYPFFDALHKKIEGSFCIDPARQFYAGFSTGARLGYMLDCAFPDVLRATATIQGALPPIPTCKKNPIAMMVLADTLEMGNPYMANVQAAQRVFGQNGCTGTFMTPQPPMGCGTSCTTFDSGAAPLAPPTPTPTCVTYSGCPAAYPIVFCTTQSGIHGTFEPWSDQAFWNFFKQF